MAPTIPDIPVSANLNGYSVLVTGANSGIGFENARQYLQLGASPLYMPVRSLEKGEQAKRELLSDPIIKRNNPDAVIHIYQLDLSSLESVKTFATKLTENVKQLNILVLNAGVNIMKYSSTIDNNETVFQVNYLSNALLATYLTPLLKTSAASMGKASHLAIVGSDMHKMAGIGTKKVIPDNTSIISWFNDKGNMGMDRYNLSKFLVTAYTTEFASRISSDEIIVNSMCPGLVSSNLDAQLPFWLKGIMKVVRAIAARHPSEGARAVTLATLTGPEGNGKYYSNGVVAPINQWLASEDGRKFQTRLWNETQQYLVQFDPTVPVF